MQLTQRLHFIRQWIYCRLRLQYTREFFGQE